MTSVLSFTAGALALALCAACSRSDETPADAAVPATGVAQTPEAASSKPQAASQPRDKFTYANYNDIRITHLELDLDVDFAERTLDGTATLDFNRLDPDATTLILDTNDLTIRSVEAQTGDAWSPAEYTLGPDDETLGAKLEITLPADAEKVRIGYRTSPDAEGLQWLAPEQTAGKSQPFMYSQNQAINARSMAPVQDTPAVRITYSAVIRTPKDVVAVMSAEQDDGPRDGEYTFDMPQPVPAYLLAIAAGDLEFEAISDRIGVYGEDYIVEAAAREFEDTPKMEAATVALYGPYLWGRYDLLVLPPSFPFGGMENPRLSFMTPTLIAGDKSLTNVVAHELAHSWSGNLVTNATWRDAWLNEGFTTYVENRVMEAVYGRERAVMEQALGLEDLRRDIAEAERPELTQLKLPADLAHPDDAFSQVAYEKGHFFLMFLEERYGRQAFDAFLRSYFEHFAFKSITTEDFKAYLEENLAEKNPDAVTASELDEWLYKPGLPSTAANPDSDAFEKVAAQQAAWLAGDVDAKGIETENWSAHEWLHFIGTLPSDATTEQLAALDEAFNLSNSENAEIASAWYLKAIPAGYEPAMAPLEEFLKRVGRGKFIYRLYDTLAKNSQGDFARKVYAEARSGYHPLAQRRIDEILNPQ